MRSNWANTAWRKVQLPMRKSAIGRRGVARDCSGNDGTPRRPRINGRLSRSPASRRKAGRSVGISDGPAAKQWLSPSTVAVTRTRCRVRPPAIQPGSVSVRLLTVKCKGACSKRARAASASSSALANSRTHWLPGTLLDAAGFNDSIGIPILRGASALVNTNGARSRRNSGTLKSTCIARAARSAAADRSAAPDISVKLVVGSHGNSPQLLSDSGRKHGLVWATVRPTPFGSLQHNCGILARLRPVAEPHRDL